MNPAQPAKGPALDLRSAERCCADLARREAKNFYWGFISLPYEQRIAIYALYGFARQVDDDADGPNRRELPDRLNHHRERIARCARGEWDRDDPFMQVLAHAVRRYAIPESELLELVEGVELDFFRKRYRTWEELKGYCRLVASVVGRMCVRIFGFTDPSALDRADDLGIALQLTNILRDVREDASMDRIYLPGEDLERFGVGEDELMQGAASERWRALVAFEAERARSYFADGYRVLRLIPRRSAVCVHTMAGIYERILEKIERDPDFPLRGRTSLSPSEKLLVMVGSWLHPT